MIAKAQELLGLFLRASVVKILFQISAIIVDQR